MKRWHPDLVALVLLLPFLYPWAEAADGDVLLRALDDELGRSVHRLRLENLEAPYHIAYHATDSRSFRASASFGGLTAKDASMHCSVEVTVRVGDYVLEGEGQGWGTLPLEADYDAIRQQLWLSTDEAYKGALAELARKRAFLQTTDVRDRPDDFMRLAPEVHGGELAKLEVDEKRWVETVRKVSAVFREFAAVQDSDVEFSAEAGNSHYLNSEGFRYQKGQSLATLTVTARTQAEDGMRLSDFETFRSRTAAELPSDEEILRRAKALGDRLSQRAKAPRAEEYVGPVLFESWAAAELFLNLLVDNLSNPKEPFGASEGGTPFKNRLRRRVLPRFISIHDDPTTTHYEGSPLLGSFLVDDDGVAARKVSLVEDGRLLTWYMSRRPTKEVAQTNGHSLGGVGGPGNVFVLSKEAADRDRMKKALIDAARDQELTYGLRVVTLMPGDIGRARRSSFRFNTQEGIPEPVEVYRVYVADGHEEPVRGGEFQGVTLRTLRDILLAGSGPLVYHTRRMGKPVSVVCPSILVEEMEVKSPGEKQAKRPYLKNPLFE